MGLSGQEQARARGREDDRSGKWVRERRQLCLRSAPRKNEAMRQPLPCALWASQEVKVTPAARSCRLTALKVGKPLGNEPGEISVKSST